MIAGVSRQNMPVGKVFAIRQRRHPVFADALASHQPPAFAAQMQRRYLL